MARTIEQQLAEAEAKVARLKTRQKAQETRRKIIVGAVVIADALRTPESAKRLAAVLRKGVTRDIDQREIASLLDELDEKVKAP